MSAIQRLRLSNVMLFPYTERGGWEVVNEPLG